MVKHDVITPLVYTIRLYRGWLKSENEVYQFLESGSLKELSSTTVNRWMKSRDTERIVLDFEKDGIYGTLFIPAGKGPFPGKWLIFAVDCWASGQLQQVTGCRTKTAFVDTVSPKRVTSWWADIYHTFFNGLLRCR